MKSKFVATMLCLFLGGLGIHKFYLDKNGAGILYLIFSWTFIPTFFSLFDFIKLVLMSKRRFNKIYNQEC